MILSRQDHQRCSYPPLPTQGTEVDHSLDAPCDFTRFVDGLLRINEAAQLHGALVSFDIPARRCP